MNATAVSPAGVKMNTASGLASLIRWTNGANSGFLSGTRNAPTTSPPFAVNTFLNVASASRPGAVVADQRVDLLDLVLGGPLGDRRRHLRQRERHPHDVGRLRGDRAGRGVHDDHRDLRLGRDRRDRHRVRRQAEAGQELHLVARHQLLRHALGEIGRRAGRVLDDELDLLAGDRVAVRLHVRAHAVRDLTAVGRERPRHLHHDADLDRLLGDGRRRGPTARTLPTETENETAATARTTPIRHSAMSCRPIWMPLAMIEGSVGAADLSLVLVQKPPSMIFAKCDLTRYCT